MSRRIRVGQVARRKTNPPGSSAVVAPGAGSVLTTKGDVHTYDTDDVRLAVGSDGHVLTADSTQAKGIKWAAASVSAIDDLSDVDTTTDAPSTNDRLYWDGSNWVPIGPLLVPDSGSPKVPMTNEAEDEWIYGD